MLAARRSAVIDPANPVVLESMTFPAPVIEVAIRRFRAHQALREELETTRATLAARRVIDAAKARLMETRRLSEQEAYRRLRRMAMDRGIRLAEAARSILATK